LTLDEIREQGLDALRRRLGRAGMVRFLQQFSDGKGDYAGERHAWVHRMSLADLRRLQRAGKHAKRRRLIDRSDKSPTRYEARRLFTSLPTTADKRLSPQAAAA